LWVFSEGTFHTLSERISSFKQSRVLGAAGFREKRQFESQFVFEMELDYQLSGNFVVTCATGELGSDNFRNNHENYAVFMISSDVVNLEKKLGHPNLTNLVY
jgi:hypothetical protein